MVSPDSIGTAWPPSGRNSTYPSVQISGTSSAKRLRGLETENAKLKKLLAEAMLDNAALKDLLAKKS